MSYAIIRNANYKKENLAGLYKHNERKNTNYSNKDINKNNSIKNYSLKQCNTTYSNAIKNLIHKNNLQGRIIKTTNIACEFIITSDKEFFDAIGIDETKRYFQTAYDFVTNYKNLGEKYIISAKVHLDESTPHLHLVFVPVIHTKDKQGNKIDKIACSQYWKEKDSYRQLQGKFYSYMIENTNLILQQNKELVQYTNKLKLQLSKTYSLINKAEQLRKENTYLKAENVRLKTENNRLKNYIDKTFEVVKHLFNFPTKILKNIVENFITHIEK